MQSDVFNFQGGNGSEVNLTMDLKVIEIESLPKDVEMGYLQIDLSIIDTTRLDEMTRQHDKI